MARGGMALAGWSVFDTVAHLDVDGHERCGCRFFGALALKVALKVAVNGRGHGSVAGGVGVGGGVGVVGVWAQKDLSCKVVPRAAGDVSSARVYGVPVGVFSRGPAAALAQLWQFLGLRCKTWLYKRGQWLGLAG